MKLSKETRNFLRKRENFQVNLKFFRKYQILRRKPEILEENMKFSK